MYYRNFYIKQRRTSFQHWIGLRIEKKKKSKLYKLTQVVTYPNYSFYINPFTRGDFYFCSLAWIHRQRIPSYLKEL